MANALERATSIAALQAVFKLERGRLRRSCFGPDRVTGEAFERSLPRSIREIRRRLHDGFRPDGLLAIAKPKLSGGNRIICVPTIGDRLLQFSLLNQLRERLHAMKLDNKVSYGIAPGAARSVVGARQFACSARRERPWVYKADIQKFFDAIDRELLRRAVERRVAQHSLYPVLEAFLDAEICDGLDRDWRRKVAEAGIRTGRGVRQGMPLSPFFAGAYLVGVDQVLIKTGIPVARYVDDIVAFFDDEAQCRSFHQLLKLALADVGLEIGDIGERDSKTCIFAPEEPAAFLGMEISRQANGRYSLCVPDRVMEVVRTRFEESASPTSLLARRVRLTSMGQYFSSVVCGYLNAYRGAQNENELEALLRGLARSAQESVLVSLFADRLHELDSDELRFVGVDPGVLEEIEGPMPGKKLSIAGVRTAAPARRRRKRMSGPPQAAGRSRRS